MIKKIMGGLLICMAILTLLGAIENEDVFSIIPVIVFVCSGIFLITFDGIKKLSHIERIKKRSTQNVLIVVFTVLYVLFAILAGLGAVASYNTRYALGGDDNFLMLVITFTLPYFIPLGMFSGMLGMYVFPFSACKKQFNYDANVAVFFDINDIFYSYSADNSVLANSKILFFPNLLCAIPFDQIVSTKFVNMGVEKDVYFMLLNGKKISVPSGKYDEITNAININRQNSVM